MCNNGCSLISFHFLTILVATTTAVPCHDVTYINCSDSHVCSDIQLKKYCPESCGLCGKYCPQ